ncbi:hypothetical protein MVEG_11226 [Podila verticillata NRRL 6337]|uniref:XPG-I domain-containing protein n=1 Tax=Podila verticillata NRRL 6337 TaxID=1069443 RepID=A0A086TML4_9FUNG|nr:hypothetical protein MVEG_11226 [Podila verticillata NRRL 6337]
MGYEAHVLSQFPRDPLPSNSYYRLDVLASFFSTIRRTYNNHDLTTANIIFERHLSSCQLPKSSTFLYVDGPSPEEKRHTQELREARRVHALERAEACMSDMEDIFGRGGRLRKSHFRKLIKHIDGSFYWSLDARRSLSQFLRDQGWNIVECPSEADIAIAKDCTANDIVISGDSDSLIYASIRTIWRPLARGGYLVYDVQVLLKQLEMSRAALTVLGIVCRNDYSSNITRMGVSTNYSIIQPLNDTDPGAILQAYMAHEEVACKHPSKTHFNAAYTIFVLQEFTVAGPSVPPQTFNQEDATQDPSQRPVALEDIFYG